MELRPFARDFGNFFFPHIIFSHKYNAQAFKNFFAACRGNVFINREQQHIGPLHQDLWKHFFFIFFQYH